MPEARADYLTRRWTGVHTFIELLNPVDDPLYFPSLIPPMERQRPLCRKPLN